MSREWQAFQQACWLVRVHLVVLALHTTGFILVDVSSEGGPPELFLNRLQGVFASKICRVAFQQDFVVGVRNFLGLNSPF